MIGKIRIRRTTTPGRSARWWWALVLTILLLGAASPAAAARTPVGPLFVTDVVSQLDYSHCLDVYHSGTANYTPVDLWTCNNTNAQRWNFVYLGAIQMGRVYQIKAGVGTNMCLDDYHSGTGTGNKVDIYQCDGSAAQAWVARGSELVSGVNPNALMCLTVAAPSAFNGAVIAIEPCGGGVTITGQYWDF